MANKTAIEWSDATWQPITGCTIVSPGCTNCYAMKLAGTRLQHHPSRAGLTKETKAGPVWTGEVRLNEKWLDQPLRWRRGRMIFVCAHGDLFHESVPDEWIDKVFAVMALAPHHVFQVLTKRAKRMREYVDGVRDMRHVTMPDGTTMRFGPWAHVNAPPQGAGIGKRWPLPNVWLGVSAERQQEADERIPELLATPAAVRFVSAEPLLGPIDLTRICLVPQKPGSIRAGVHVNTLAGRFFESGMPYYDRWNDDGTGATGASASRLDWVIVGGESGPGARPMHPDWARSLRDQCQAAGVAYFFKQWGAWQDGSDFAGDAKVVLRDARVIANTRDAAINADREKPVASQNPTLMRNVGKARAGRLLDGREWNEMPEARR